VADGVPRQHGGAAGFLAGDDTLARHHLFSMIVNYNSSVPERIEKLAVEATNPADQ